MIDFVKVTQFFWCSLDEAVVEVKTFDADKNRFVKLKGVVSFDLSEVD